MTFTYFTGPKEDMQDLVAEKCLCCFCNTKSDNCFDLSFAIAAKYTSEEKEGKYGCYNCLVKGEFEFWHDTEFGLIDEKGISKVYSHNMDNPPAIDADRLQELRRTPQIATYQQELWLTHCNDFMVYKGTWQPKDFYKNSPSGDGRELFMEMTNKDINFLWDESLEEGQQKLETWYPTYYVFECRHCKKLRGNWDCD